jgi:hypothetical protein
MRPPNFGQARKERERSRKLRQSEKQQRRLARLKQARDASSATEEGAQKPTAE